MYSYTRLITIFFIVIKLSYGQQQELLNNNCDSHYDSFNTILIKNTNRTTAASYKECSLHFKSQNNADNFILKININSSLCVNLTVKINSDNNNNNQNVDSSSKNLCDLVKATTANYVLLLNKTDHFQVTLSSNDVASRFEAINYVAVTKLYYADNVTNTCQTNDFKCKGASNICINGSLACDAIKACPDDSDEENCQQVTTTATTTTTFQELNSTSSSNMNATVVDKPTAPNSRAFNRVNVLVGLLVTLIIVIVIVGLLWILKRRKKRFREFLAQLDNNTDWEYEQLDDNPSVGNSRTTMTPVFSMLNHNENLRTRNINQSNSTANKDDINLMHTMSDVNRNTAANNTAAATSSNSNSRNAVNERTPITVIS